MFLFVRCLLKLSIFMKRESLYLSRSIPSIFVSLAFVHNCCFPKFNSTVLHGSLVYNIVSFECHLCNLKPPCKNKLMESDFNFLTWFIFSPPVTKSFIYTSSLTFSITSRTFFPQLSK